MKDLTYGEAKPRVESFCAHRSSLKFIVCGTCEEDICIELYDALLYYFISMVGKSVTQKVNFTIFKICAWKYWIDIASNNSVNDRGLICISGIYTDSYHLYFL